MEDVAVDSGVLQLVPAAREVKGKAITKGDHSGLAIDDHLIAPANGGPSESIMARRAASYYRSSDGTFAGSKRCPLPGTVIHPATDNGQLTTDQLTPSGQ